MIKKFRYSYWMFLGFIRKHTLLLLLGVALGLIVAVFSPRLIALLPKPIPKEKIAVIGRPTLSELPLFIQKQISLGLTSISPSGEALPSLAKEYKVEEDGKRFKFLLRKDKTWHDGKPFTAEDINYNFSDVQMHIISDTEVVFELKEPFAPFPTVLSQPLFRSEKSKLLPTKSKLLGLGPMRVTQISRNGQFITNLSLKSSDRIRIYRFYNTQEAAILAFKLGEVDEILELSSPGELASWPNTTIKEVIHQDRYVALFFNTQDSFLSSKNLRQSLVYAIQDKEQDSVRSISPINPNSWAYNPQVKLYKYDLSAAQRLLSPDEGESAIIPKNLELTTTLPYLSVAEDIKNQWLELGINTTIKVATFLPETFQVLLIAQEIPPDPDQYSIWHSIQSTNLTDYNSPKIDKLLEDGRQTIDQKERTQIYQDFQRFLVEDSPAAFLFHHRTFTVKRS